MMTRLHPLSLDRLNDDVRQPAYNREALQPGIVHLGLGAFHRAHQAVYTEDAIERSAGDWGIIGVSLRSGDVAQQLRPQEGLYSVLSEDDNGAQLRVVGVVVDVLVAPEQPEQVVAAIARQAIKVITLTITEKGYALAADGCSLDVQHPQISHDLANPQQPQSALGFLALGLQQRLAAGGAPVTIISCDNLAANSERLRTLLQAYLRACFPEVLPWLAQSVCFPCSMVDRIVPAMTAQRRTRQAQQLGVLDEAAVSTETFTQWIIEDKFAAARPDWAGVGVQLVSAIAPFENIKLRLLNATHSAIAYLGLVAGLETVDQVMADQPLSLFVHTLMTRDLMPALEAPAGFDMDAYARQLLARFKNPGLEHRCAQIAMDGSEKIRQRWLPRLRASEPAPWLVAALGVWCYFVLRTDTTIDDPRALQLQQQRDSQASLEDRVGSVLQCVQIDSRSIPHIADVITTVVSAINTLDAVGARAFVQRV